MPFGAQRWRNEADDGGVEAVDSDDEAKKGNIDVSSIFTLWWTGAAGKRRRPASRGR
jgi:hypothetical protein